MDPRQECMFGDWGRLRPWSREGEEMMVLSTMSSVVRRTPVVLVVDDDVLFQETVSRAASADGLATMSLVHGKETRHVAAARQPDLILLRAEMPDADGRHVLRQLKRDALTRHIPVFIYGQQETALDRRLALHLGAADYWIRPLDLCSLIPRIRFHIEKPVDATERQKPKMGVLDTWPDLSEVDRSQAEELVTEARRRTRKTAKRTSDVAPASRPVLIVENDSDIRQSLCDILEDEGITVVTASNGEEALELLQGTGVLPLVIFLDLMMPRMSGWELHRRIAASTAVPIVVLSALPSDDSMESITWLQKPVRVEQVLSIIARARLAETTESSTSKVTPVARLKLRKG